MSLQTVVDAICDWIIQKIERLAFAAILWIDGSPDKPWDPED